MPRSSLTPEHLWSLPRVGAPVPSPDGSRVVVPVTAYSIGDNLGRTRLWLVPSDARHAGRGGRRDPARPLTSADASASQPRWSPDGTELLFVRKPGGEPGKKGGPDHPDQPQLYRLRLDGGEPERLTDLALGVQDPRWLPGTRRVVFLAAVHLDAPDPKGTAERVKAEREDPTGARATEDRFYRLWDGWVTGRVRRHLHVLALDSGKMLDLTPGFEAWTSPMEAEGHLDVAPDGKTVALAATVSRPPHDPLLWGVYLVRVPARLRAGAHLGHPRRIGPKDDAQVSGPRFSPDGRRILYGIRRDRTLWADRTRLAVWDLEKRRHTVLTEKWTLSAQSWCWGADGRRAFATADVEGRGGLFSVSLRGVVEEVARGGTYAAPLAAGNRLFAQRSGLLEPPEAVVIDPAQGRERALTAFTRPVLSGTRPGRVEEVVFDGADGDPVQMWLVHPPEGKRRRGKARPPLLHLIHGGPHGSFGDVWHWRWNAQVFAAAGYLCALVNFHGSTGWGQAFASSIVGEWGDKPFRDIEAATDHLIATGRCDRKRLAAAGGSYGGYLVSWIASRTGRYRCLVNHAGVCDMQTQFSSDIPQGWPRSAGGDLWSDRDGLDRFNPLRHAEGFSSPMLILHGEKDYRVPYYQALQLYNVYKARGLDARLVVYPDENHWILKPQASLHWYGEFLGWLDRYL